MKAKGMRNLRAKILGGVLLSVSVFFFAHGIAFSQEKEPSSSSANDIPAGMEILQITSGHRLIIPEGAKTRRIGAQIFVETDQEYFSRRFYELSQEIISLKEQIQDLQDQVKKLQEKCSVVQEEES